MSQERLERYFIQRGQSYQVVPEIRQMIVFAPHNVIRDAPFTRIDLVELPQPAHLPAARGAAEGAQPLPLRAEPRRHRVLWVRARVSALLGHDFETVDKHWRIYRKYSDVRTPIEPRLQVRKVEPEAVAALSGLQPRRARHSLGHLLGTYDTLLERFMPPSLLVSDRGELLHASAGRVDFFAIATAGRARDVLDAVDGELKMVLVGGLKRALSEPSALVFKNVRIAAEGETRAYRVDAFAPVPKPRRRVAERPRVVRERWTRRRAPPNAPATEIDVGDVPHAQIAALARPS